MAKDSAHGVSFEAGDLARLVARARFLHERRLPATKPWENGDWPSLSTRWRDALEVDSLDSRFAWDAASGDLGSASAAQGCEDGWVGILTAALRACPAASRAFAEATPQEFTTGDSPVAFEQILAPFLIVARCELSHAAGDAIALLSDPARATLERSLVQILSRLSLAALEMEFGLFRALDGRSAWRRPGGGSEMYHRFVERMLNDGLAGFLLEYAVLARLLAQWVRNWARLHAELLLRLRKDWSALQQWLGLDRADGEIKAIVPYRSDPHHGGRAVTLLELGSGRWLVYKPRGLAMEQVHGQLLEWINARGFSQPFRPPRVMDQGEYGWMEYIAYTECGDSAEVEEFYWRLGAHLALLYFLQGTDFHHENLIAHGGQPVWIDSETLLQPRMREEHSRTLGPGSHRLQNSQGDFALAETGVLPTGKGGRNGESVDFSALGASAEQETPFKVVSCTDLNTDSMALSSESYRVAVKSNVALLGGRMVCANERGDALLAGFEELFRLVVRHRTQWLNPAGPLRHFRGCRGRYILRSTHAYGLLMQEALRPEWLRDGAARGIVFEVLRASAMRGCDRPAVWRLFDLEQRALERMDVPYFSVACETGSPASMGGKTGQLWPAPLEEVRRRVALASEGQLPLHLNAIRTALGLSESAHQGARETVAANQASPP